MTTNSHQQILKKELAECRKAEAALRENEEFYRSVLETSPDAITLTDIEGNILMCNAQTVLVHGFEREQEVLGKNAAEFYPPEEAARVQENIARTLHEGSIKNVEYTLLRKDGSRFPAEFSAAVIRDPSGAPKFFMGITRDITERKRAEEIIRRQLQENEILLKEVHHRIKNNIASIAGQLTLQLDSITNPEAKNIINETIGRIECMGLVYKKLLQTKNYQEESSKDYLEGLAACIAQLYPERQNITVTTEINDCRLGVKYLFPLGAIVNELISNAMKYAFSGKEAGQITIGLTKKGNKITLLVADNGKGLPENFVLEKSTGFGLMIVGMFVQQLGGSLAIASDKGTRCTVTFSV